MPVLYNGKKIIPAPYMEINKQYQKTAGGDIIGATYAITLVGKLLSHKGSPDSSGNFWTLSGYPADEVSNEVSQLKALQRKQEALRGLFATEGLLLESAPWDGSAPIKANVRVLGMDFPAGLWFNVCDYTINLEADELIGISYPTGEDSFAQYISDAQESWSIQSNEAGETESQLQTYQLTHNISAVGKKHYNLAGSQDQLPWQYARKYVQAKLGIDLNRAYASGLLNLPSYFGGFNHMRSEEVDVNGGSYSATETWILASGNAIEDFAVNVNTSNSIGLTSVSIAGSIQGLETRNTSTFAITQSKFAAASGRFDVIKNQLLTRAQNYAGVAMNPISLSTQVGYAPIGGLISYEYVYDNRPSNITTGALMESISIVEQGGGDVFAAIPVLGRTAGPVLQAINTKTATTRELSIEIVMPIVSANTYAAWLAGKPNINPILVIAKPTASQVFTNDPNESWNPRTGQYSYNISWTYQ